MKRSSGNINIKYGIYGGMPREPLAKEAGNANLAMIDVIERFIFFYLNLLNSKNLSKYLSTPCTLPFTCPLSYIKSVSNLGSFPRF